jgi:hypothetical protein
MAAALRFKSTEQTLCKRLRADEQDSMPTVCMPTDGTQSPNTFSMSGTVQNDPRRTPPGPRRVLRLSSNVMPLGPLERNVDEL